jgi:hypothetical protein
MITRIFFGGDQCHPHERNILVRIAGFVDPCLGLVDVHHRSLKVCAIGMMQFKYQYCIAKPKKKKAEEPITFFRMT